MRLVTPLLLFFLCLPHLAFGQVALRGTLSGADGSPMKAAHVIVKDGPAGVHVVAAADERGRFSLELPEPGGYGMYVTGVHHKTLEMPLVVTGREPVALDVQLGTYDYQKERDSVWVTTPSAQYEKKGATLMQKSGDNAFTASIPAGKDTIAYKIIGMRAAPASRYAYTISGTDADRYSFSEEGP